MTNSTRRGFLMGSAATIALLPLKLNAATTGFSISTPMEPPEWALLERELLRANTQACVKFWERYFNADTGYLEHVERWDGNDGPDDAIEHLND